LTPSTIDGRRDRPPWWSSTARAIAIAPFQDEIRRSGLGVDMPRSLAVKDRGDQSTFTCLESDATGVVIGGGFVQAEHHARESTLIADQSP
jgi:hypothetical protein